MDLIDANPHDTNVSNRAILSITDDTRTFSRVAVLADDKIDSMAATIWHHWCQPYGNPETILSNQGKVWTSKLESWINNFTPLEQKINCRSEKETFNPEVRQQWQLSRQDTSADEFAQTWNFLCDLQGPATSKSGLDSLNEVDQNLDDVEDFVEDHTIIRDHSFEVPGREIYLRRKQVSLCRHKLQGRAYPKVRKIKTVLRPQEQLLKPGNPEVDHEWLQLIQMERAIENHKNKLLETGVEDRWVPDKDHKTFWEDEESLAKQDDHLDDRDLEYINVILNAISRQSGNHRDSNNSKLESFTPEDALTRALASPRTPPDFNLKFNQNLTTRRSEADHFSYFSNIEEEGTTELGDYFSDDEEDDTWDKEDLSSESNPWSHTDFNNSEENFPHSQPTLYEWDPVISGLETINEARFKDDCEANKLNHISGLSEQTKLAFSTWQLFIPPEHAFRNCAAPSQLSDFLSQASSFQEPTLTQISTISTSTERTSSPMKPTSPRLVTSLLQQKDWPSFKLATRPFTPNWTRPWTKSTRTSNRTENWLTEFQDHPEQSKRFRHWKRKSQCSNETNHNPDTKSQSTPQVINAGSEPRVCTQSKSRNYSTMKPKRSTIQIKSWETKWRKFSNRTPICRTKIAEEYQTPSEKLKKDPIMALVTKTVSTYMFLRHSRDRKTKTQTEDFSWGEPFFKKKE